MDGRACARCGTGADQGARFCTSCGHRLGTGPAADPAPYQTADPAPYQTADPAPYQPAGPGQSLVECEACSAVNAASRPLCARCGSPLREEVPGGDALPDALPPSDGPPPGGHGEGPSVLLALVLLAGLVTAGVLLALVTARVTAEDADGLAGGVRLSAASASSSLDGHPPSAAIDEDPATAWTEAAPGAGEEEWLEVTLAREVTVRRLLVWNGDQTDERRFSDNGRAAVVRIEVGDRQFRVTLRDTPGPQAVDLPEGVLADHVRLVIENTIPGQRYTDLAISEIVVEGD